MGLMDAIKGAMGDPEAQAINERRAGASKMDLATAQREQLVGHYAKQYPFMADAFSDPGKLMQIVKDKSDVNRDLSAGGTPDFFVLNLAKQALSDIYRMPDFVPPGYMGHKSINPRDIR